MTATRDGRLRLRWRLEFLLLRGAAGFFGILPRRAAFALARGCGTLLHALLLGRVVLARTQAAAALNLPADGPEVVAIVRASFRHFMRVSIELLLLDRVVKGRADAVVRDLVTSTGREHVEGVRAQGRCVICVTGHLGNWEVMGALAPHLGLPLLTVSRRVENPLLEAEIHRLRTRYGLRVVDKEGAGLPLARELKSGGLVAILLDQHAGSRGMRIPFFHSDASTFTFIASAARRFGAALVPSFSRSGERFCELSVDFHPPIWPDASLPEAEDAYRMLRLYNQSLEAAVRSTPGQYLWSHRRWKKGGEEPDPAWRARYAPAG